MQGRRRRIRLSAYAVAAALLLYGLALGYSAFQTHRHLLDAQAEVGLLRAAMVRQDAPAAEVDQRLRNLQTQADAARSLTDGPLWGLPASVPWLGRPFETVRGASAAVSSIAHDVLPPVGTARDGLVGVDLKNPKGGIDLRPIAAAVHPLGQASSASDAVLADVRALPVSGVGPVDRGRADLLDQVEALSRQLRSAHEAVTVLPPMLGADGPRRYMVAFQNNAEARGAGGLPGVYAVVRADRGRLSFEHYGVSGDFAGIEVPLTGLSEGYAGHYQGAAPGAFFGNATVSPHFPDGATLLLRYWKAKTGERLDGAMAIDPTALSKLLAVTGPTSLEDGTRVGAANVVALVERDAYERFADPAVRKLYLIEVAKAVADDVLERGPEKGTQLAGALGKAVAERRLLVFSTHKVEQGVLERRPVGGAVSGTDGLFSGVVINNGGGNKLDYYLEREVTYEAAPCSSPTPDNATVTIRLTNRAPRSGLTDYVAGRADRPVVPVKRGTNRLLVGYYATKGAAFSDATLDGKPELLSVDSERGRPVFTSTLEIAPGQTRVLRMTIEEPPGAKGPVTTLVQPLVLPQKTTVTAPAC
ncbi:MAG TPA: DUF4012 domain-containing protein [Pedococcus sp.]|nr:DUF4012 domain-containing protein [Pedococcus sp.]